MAKDDQQKVTIVQRDLVGRSSTVASSHLVHLWYDCKSTNGCKQQQQWPNEPSDEWAKLVETAVVAIKYL